MSDSISKGLPGNLESRLNLISLQDARRIRQKLRALSEQASPSQEALTGVLNELLIAESYIKERAGRLPKLAYDQALPVCQMHDEIVDTIKNNRVVVIAGETGSGKTTQIPKMCLEAGLGLRGMIGHTQPRRIAARAVASRIADEMGESLGKSVGYKVRFTDVTSPECFLKVMTDGMLLSETASDRLLLNYDCIIIDEAHERSLNIDFLLGYIKKLMQKRRDLKLIITSATIDPGRFAAHFGNAPVIEVSGRTYPVDVIYMPPVERDVTDDSDNDEEESGDTRTEILRALKFLRHEFGPGDTLVFLPGERDIMETAAFLNRSHLPDTEILPLFARLSASEQNKIFTPHQGTRVVLSTNVAETSLTVPGIRYVIDPGTARVSRYSPRTKVQRLPVEKISQASANQRKGRCGRVSDGVCVRLYSEEDFLSRSEYTDPEILRTNLAAVILQMAALRLGDITKFPFIDPPETRQVTDGLRLLEELGAITPGNSGTESLSLTQIGRQLSRIPVDPRLGRMLIEAVRYNSVAEILIIISALSVMDPREVPLSKQEAARQWHHRFDDEKSDFLSFIKLHAYLCQLQTEQSSSQFRKTLKKEFISYLRVREWFDTLRQLRATCQILKFTVNKEEASYEAVHRAVVAGLLSQIGELDENEKGVYKGARGVKFYIHPSSGLGRKRPKWVCACELSETTRLYARGVAAIDPLWLEWAGAHLIRKNYAQPHWSRSKGAVTASLSVTLYGLTIVSGREVMYTAVDPALCRTLLIRDGLVGGDVEKHYDFLERNLKLVDEVSSFEDRARRRDLLVDPTVLEDFYSGRLPADITTLKAFDKWWREKRKGEPKLLNFTKEMLLTDKYSKSEQELYPTIWQQGTLSLPLTYVFDPSKKDDGVSVHVPLALLNQIKYRDFLWQVPGLRPEFLSALIKSLPKRLRRNLIPAPDYAKALSEALGDDVTSDLMARAVKELTRMGGEKVEAGDFDLSLIPPHLFMTFVVEDAGGTEVGRGKDFLALSDKLHQKTSQALQQAVRQAPQPTSSVWSYGEIKKSKITKSGKIEIKTYPALTDKGKGVTLEQYDSPVRQEKAMWRGQRRLLQLSVKEPAAYLEAHLPNKAKLAMYYQPLGTVKDLISDLSLAAVDAIMRRHGAPAWDEKGFNELLSHVKGELNDEALKISKTVEQILYAAHDLKHTLKGRIPLEYARSYQDVGAQLDSLVCKNFVSETPADKLVEIPRYLKAAALRLERLPRELNRDLARLSELEAVLDRYKEALRRYHEDLIPDDLKAVRWAIEELRVSYFAQQLGVKGPVSDKRIENEIRRVLETWLPQR